MSRFWGIFLIALFILLFVLQRSVTSASAANTATSLDERIARSYSGVADLQVYCSDSQEDWQAVTAANGYTTPWIDGFTYPGNPKRKVVYISPWMCNALHGDIGDDLFGPALDVLLHESLHWVYGKNEGTTECASLRELPSALLRYFVTDYYDPWAWQFILDNPVFQAHLRNNQRPPEYRDCTRLK